MSDNNESKIKRKEESYKPLKKGYTPAHGGVQDSYQPETDTLPSNPPGGGSGVPPKKSK